ncbi:MAG: hypothetical protein KatS3mg090_0655 [Patescibacteria group bacterium]|nr:MAG: hypothetical protein KatS3mg090_0655 [Patescibacteria group bacterium]
MGKMRIKTLGQEDQDKVIDTQSKEHIDGAEKDQIKKAENQDTKRIRLRLVGEKQKKAKDQVDKVLKKNNTLDIRSAIRILKKISYANFDETFEVHINVKKQGLKGEAVLPYGTGKKKNIVIVDDGFIKDLQESKINLDSIDVLIATPSYMPKLSKFAKVLGPKKLFPNPKQGTLTDNPEDAVSKFNSGLIQWKTEAKFPLIHQAIGKKSFTDEQIEENFRALINSVGKTNIVKCFLKLTMTPAVPIDLASI